MAYVTQQQIIAAIPAPELVDALDDDGDDAPDEGLLDQIISNASDAVDGLICARYAVPLTDPPKSVLRAAFVFACESIYRRRRVPDDQNGFKAEAEMWRKQLAEIGKGERQLDASVAVDLQANSGGNPFVPGRVPVAGSAENY